MGSENRKRAKGIQIRLTQDEYTEIKTKATEVNRTVPSYLRQIAISGTAPEFGDKYFANIWDEIKDLNKNIKDLYFMAKLNKLTTIEFGPTLKRSEDLLNTFQVFINRKEK